MEKVKVQRIRLGIFVVVATIFFIISMYFLGEKQNLFGSTFRAYAIFNDVNGLQKGNNVRFSGIDVGTVTNVKVVNDSSILVTMVIEDKIREFIKKDALATLGTDGLMGNKLVNISAAKLGEIIVAEGDTLPSVNELDTDDILSKLEETNNNIAVITGVIAEIVTDIHDGKGTVGKLMTDTTLSESIDQTLNNLNRLTETTVRISKNIEESIAQINNGEGTVGLLTDTSLAGNIEQMVHELTLASSNMEKITVDIENFTTELKKGEGIINSVFMDTTLSRNLEKSMSSIQQGSESFNQNMEALKHNFLFRRYFRRQEKKQRSK